VMAQRHEATVWVEVLGTVRLAGGDPGLGLGKSSETEPGPMPGHPGLDSGESLTGGPASSLRPTYRVLQSAVERFLAWWKGGFRHRALRHERLLATFQGFVMSSSTVRIGRYSLWSHWTLRYAQPYQPQHKAREQTTKCRLSRMLGTPCSWPGSEAG